MAKDKKEEAVRVVKNIMAEVNDGVIRDFRIPALCNVKTCQETGFAVVLTLSAKYDYSNTVLDNWKDRMGADDYIIQVLRNQLIVRFNFHYEEE